MSAKMRPLVEKKLLFCSSWALGVAVVQAPICPHPGFGGELTGAGAGQNVCIAGGEGVEGGVVGGTDGPPYGGLGRLDIRRMGDQGGPACGD